MELIDLTKKLISIESITGNEYEIAEFIASQLDFADVEMQNVDGFGSNVIARHVVNSDKPIIILNCHMDTVEVMQGWESDPFKPRIQGNKMFGLGASDMKAGIAIALDVFKKAVEKDANLIFTAVSDEEGNSKGSYVLLEKLKKELEGKIGEGLCLIPEDSQEKVKLGARGRYVVEITVTGCSAHGATPERGNNAIEDTAIIVGALKSLPLNSHPILGNGSICVLKIEGGGDSLSVPDRCTIRVDRHTVIGENKEQVMSDFEKMLKNLQLKCSYELNWMKRETPFLEPYSLEVDNPWAKKFLKAYQEFYGKEPDIAYGKSVGDFNAFGKLMPTIVFGPIGENVHGPNECVYLDSIIRCRDLYLKFLTQV
jgi:acetylornithine deacetylase/succinyl-diaminopimelate desuccinylase-like protein